MCIGSPSASTSATMNQCGASDKYCPGGSGSATPVPIGSYSTPTTANVTLRTGVAVCEAGFYCITGVRYTCPGGSYGAVTGLSVSVR